MRRRFIAMLAFPALLATLAATALTLLQRPAIAADEKPHTEVWQTTRFDIAAQPLEDALYAFGAVTGVSVFADGGSLSGRRSRALQGNFTTLQGLRILLGGTGLDAHLVSPRAVALSPTLIPPGDLLTRQAVQHYSANSQQASIIIVEVLGYGGGDNAPEDDDQHRRDGRRSSNDQGQSGYNDKSAVQIAGYGPLSESQSRLLTAEERRKLNPQ